MEDILMKNLRNLMMVLVVLTAMPLAGLAMEHGKMDMDHEKMDMDHGKMGHVGMMMLGEETEDGVVAMGHAKAYDSDAVAKMAKMGMGATHHFMVSFKDQQGKPITEGTVAVKVEAGGQESKPIMLMQMGEAFGADITVPQGEEVKLKVGSKLADGKKRQFEFELK